MNDFPSLSGDEPMLAFDAETVAMPSLDYDRIRRWIMGEISHHNGSQGAVQFVFCSDPYLHALNVEYLQHDTYTDIITFPYQDPPLVEGDIFISLDRVADNAEMLGIPFDVELRRVIIHGVLHLLGYPDKTEADEQKMRILEEEALQRWQATGSNAK
jgi:probable rRNA maturation factor